MFNDNYDFEIYCDYIVNAITPFSAVSKMLLIWDRYLTYEETSADRVNTLHCALTTIFD